MLTGDSQGTARAIAAELGVDEFRAELLPEDKVAAIEELRRTLRIGGDGRRRRERRAGAGDRPTSGIAMGAAGSDAALETADVALMADELLKIPVRVPPEPRDRAQHQGEPRDLARAEGGVRRRRGGRRRDAVDGRPRRHGRVGDRDRERAAAAARGLTEPSSRARRAVA